MYKAVTILYIVCFGCYILLSRFPDYFESDFINGTVTANHLASDVSRNNLSVSYKVGSESLQYNTDMWLLNNYNIGDQVTIIYNPSIPQMASLYSFIGYWVKWTELLFTAVFFILLFLVAKSITGPPTFNNSTQNRFA